MDSYQQQIIDRARQLAAIRTEDQARAFFAQVYADNPAALATVQASVWPAAFGRATGSMDDLVWLAESQQAIIDRQTTLIAALEDQAAKLRELADA